MQLMMVVEVSITLQLTRKIHPNILILSFSMARSAPEQHISTLKQEGEATTQTEHTVKLTQLLILKHKKRQ